ncbi:hypothetical protein BC829DRAFT_384039 [Chytridium lagenaria]|nr:hypothetical protein BC829DRAFT_384039 [Chytridium lagenaria]
MPGDALITTCSYLPTQGLRTNATTFGESTTDEMCHNFIQYYPKFPPVELCVTFDMLGRALCTTKSVIDMTGLGGSPGAPGGAPTPDPSAMLGAIQNLTLSGDLVGIEKELAGFEAYKPVCLMSANPTGGTTSLTTATRSAGERSFKRRYVFVRAIVIIAVTALSLL